MRRLIINADDLGFTTDVNHGIFDSILHGVVTSATRMANGAAFDDALRVPRGILSRGDSVSFGCHVVLVDGTPLLQPEHIPTLVKRTRKTWEFRSSLSMFALDAVRGRTEPTHVQAEAEAQIRKIQQAGRRVSHVDTHKHVHMFPSVLRPILSAAKACGVRVVRNPFEPPGALFNSVSRPKLWKRAAQATALRCAFARRFAEIVASEGLATTDGTIGVIATGALGELTTLKYGLKLFGALLDALPQGTWELCCHPGFNLGQLERAKTRLKGSRLAERQLLTSSEARHAIESRDIQLISYWELK